jgi:hypothetical protein
LGEKRSFPFGKLRVGISPAGSCFPPQDAKKRASWGPRLRSRLQKRLNIDGWSDSVIEYIRAAEPALE